MFTGAITSSTVGRHLEDQAQRHHRLWLPLVVSPRAVRWEPRREHQSGLQQWRQFPATSGPTGADRPIAQPRQQPIRPMPATEFSSCRDTTPCQNAVTLLAGLGVNLASFQWHSGTKLRPGAAGQPCYRSSRGHCVGCVWRWKNCGACRRQASSIPVRKWELPKTWPATRLS